MTEETVSTKRVYNGGLLKVDEDTVTAKGGLATREVVRHPGGACVAALNESGEVVLERQFRYAFGRVLTELPAGKLEQGEDPLFAIKRELMEEAGLAAEDWTLLTVLYPTVGYSDEMIYCYMAKGLFEKRLPMDDDEDIETFSVPLEKAVEMVENGEIRDAKTAVTILLAARREKA